MKPIDDHLGLLECSFERTRLIVLTGMSGSGKTTCIDLLLAEHPDLAGRPFSWIGPAPIDWSAARVRTDLVIIDELLEWRDMSQVISLLRSGHRVVAASHLPASWIRCAGLFWPVAHFHTDRTSEKLERYLERKGVRASPSAVQRYATTFGANYTDLDIILEHTGYDDFDVALDRFERSVTLEVVRRRTTRADE